MAPTSDPAGPSGLDLSVLDRLVDFDAAKFRKYALLFVRSIEDVLGQVDEAMRNGDLPALAAMGHRAKSTAQNIGATGFSGRCLQLEQAATAGDSAGAMEIARSLRPAYEAIRQAIERRLAV